ncbi:MAG: phosphatase PAP2 family protein [Bacteroidales bacterium]|nr:phosphatase PAP2 family protein [Bacteroidales bacterium]MDD7159776.1 phosphatase PAP2 family protein [Bacteroidales bacterium]
MDFTGITNIDLWLIPVLGGSHNMFSDAFALVLTSGWTWIAMYLTLLFVVIKNNETMAQIGLVILSCALCLLLADGMADGIMKPLTMRLRPINDPEVREMITLVAGVADKNYSFFSAHAANTMAISTFMALLMRNTRMTIALLIWSLINCWTRIYLGMHYPSDIAAGLLWGMISGALVYSGYRRAYMRLSPKLHFISSQYTKTGYGLADITLTINVMTASVIYAILRALTMTY